MLPEEKRMERIVFSCGAVALIGLGVSMVVWPVWIVLKSRDEDDNHALSSGQIFATRMAGAGLVFLGGYILYALLTAMPGPTF
jgi:hypothetical protein